MPNQIKWHASLRNRANEYNYIPRVCNPRMPRYCSGVRGNGPSPYKGRSRKKDPTARIKVQLSLRAVQNCDVHFFPHEPTPPILTTQSSCTKSSCRTKTSQTCTDGYLSFKLGQCTTNRSTMGYTNLPVSESVCTRHNDSTYTTLH